jgi:hypothetical protein
LLRLAGPADLDDLLRQKQRFDATLGIEFEPAVARRALGELLARPELGRAWRILEGGAAVGYAVLCFGWSLEWGGRDAFLERSISSPPRVGAGSAARRCARSSRRRAPRASWRSISRSTTRTPPGRRSTAPKASRAALGSC